MPEGEPGDESESADDGDDLDAGRPWREGDIVEITPPPEPPKPQVEAGSTIPDDGTGDGSGDGSGDMRGDVTGDGSEAVEDLPEPPPPNVEATGDTVHVAVGLSSELDGNRDERALLDHLERSAIGSPSPITQVRRLRVGAAEPAAICREGRDDLVIRVGYLPDRDEPVLLTRDCLLDRDLGVRGSAAASDTGLVGVLWAEHREAVANGARERRRLRMNPKVRTGLIAGSAIAVVGVALGLLIAGAVQRDRVVVVVSPN